MSKTDRQLSHLRHYFLVNLCCVKMKAKLTMANSDKLLLELMWKNIVVCKI